MALLMRSEHFYVDQHLIVSIAETQDFKVANRQHQLADSRTPPTQ
jgi:hypothetical protein